MLIRPYLLHHQAVLSKKVVGWSQVHQGDDFAVLPLHDRLDSVSKDRYWKVIVLNLNWFKACEY